MGITRSEVVFSDLYVLNFTSEFHVFLFHFAKWVLGPLKLEFHRWAQISYDIAQQLGHGALASGILVAASQASRGKNNKFDCSFFLVKNGLGFNSILTLTGLSTRPGAGGTLAGHRQELPIPAALHALLLWCRSTAHLAHGACL